MKLYQFQCAKEGHLFYYQTVLTVRSNITALVKLCPICRSSRVDLTGRTFSALDEQQIAVTQAHR